MGSIYSLDSIGFISWQWVGVASHRWELLPFKATFLLTSLFGLVNSFNCHSCNSCVLVFLSDGVAGREQIPPRSEDREWFVRWYLPGWVLQTKIWWFCGFRKSLVLLFVDSLICLFDDIGNLSGFVRSQFQPIIQISTLSCMNKGCKLYSHQWCELLDGVRNLEIM